VIRKSVVLGILGCAILALGAGNPSVPTLSKRERAERLRLLPDEEKKWLEEIARPIILPDEENLFLLLTEPHEREIFREEFWKRRERDGLLLPLGPGYRWRYLQLLRLADQQYDGRREDAGRMVLAHGEPAEIDPLEGCDRLFRGLEIWTYRLGPGGMSLRRYFFTRIHPTAPRKLWTIADSDAEIFQLGSCRTKMDDLHWDCQWDQKDPCPSANCKGACRAYVAWQEIRLRQNSSFGALAEYGTILAPPPVNVEDLKPLAARFPRIADPKARQIPIAEQVPGGESPTPAPGASLTPEEIRQRILRLAPKYREFLDLAAPMFTGDELSRFLLMSDSSKDAFIREFWRRHK
jgi:GWxTD domain-containing protein